MNYELRNEQIREMRAQGALLRVIAQEFGLSQPTLTRIIHGRKYVSGGKKYIPSEHSHPASGFSGDLPEERYIRRDPCF